MTNEDIIYRVSHESLREKNKKEEYDKKVIGLSSILGIRY